MTAFPLAAVSFMMSVVGVLFVIVCVALVLVVLIQKGRGGGLSGAFGGLGAGGLFGTKTGDFLTWVTIGLTALLLSLAIIMGLYYKPIVTEADIAPSGPVAPVRQARDVDRSGAVPVVEQPGDQTGGQPAGAKQDKSSSGE